MNHQHEEVRAKNLASLKLLIEHTISFGKPYLDATHVAKHLAPLELEKFAVNYADITKAEAIADANYSKNVDSRKELYSKEYFQIVDNIIASIDLNPFDESTMNRISNIKKEMRGTRLTESKVAEEKQRSTSHLSFDNKAVLFESLVLILKGSQYQPLATNIQTTNLESLADGFKRANDQVNLYKKQLDDCKHNAKVSNDLLKEYYLGIKNIVKVTFGKDSYEYQSLSKINIF